MRPDGEAVHYGYELKIDRPRTLVFSWFPSEEEEQEKNSLVTLTLEPLGSGCRVTLVHRMNIRWAEWVPQTEKGWSLMLQQIALSLSTPAPPSPPPV